MVEYTVSGVGFFLLVHNGYYPATLVIPASGDNSIFLYGTKIHKKGDCFISLLAALSLQLEWHCITVQL
jgi:hypothetical protein